MKRLKKQIRWDLVGYEMRYIIDTIPHANQRYPTVGDYWTDLDGTKHIVVSDMQNDDYAFLIMLHELIEQKLCEYRGISEEDITQFDEAFEEMREEGNVDEPGDALEAPYYNEHNLATGIERIVCAELGIPWKIYNDTVENL